MIPRIYLLYGVAVLGLMGMAQFRGWTLFSPGSVINNVPRSVRDNPGSYRSVYSSYHHYTGGK